MCQVPALAMALVAMAFQPAAYPGWKHSGSFFIITTADGADGPATMAVEGFPILLRLNGDFFDFGQAQKNGEDMRFSTPTGEPLAYQIDEWDSRGREARIWIRIPRVVGQARQEIRAHWGNPAAKSESNGRAVFNESNGYLAVWHMNRSMVDEVSGLAPNDTGTIPVDGTIGEARKFSTGKGLFCGDKIGGFPTGSAAHSTEAWLRAGKPNGTVVAWGNEHGQGKVVMQHRSPPHVGMDCYFSDANVATQGPVPLGEWTHVIHTYEKGNSRIYVNGALDGVSANRGAPLAIRAPARLWIGGWYHNYNFAGDIDEVRVSKVARPPEWVRLQHENQKPMQTLVGPLTKPGNEFSVGDTMAVLREGDRKTFKGRADGAIKVYWLLKRGEREQVVATDRLSFDLDAGRVEGDQSFVLRFKAVYPDGARVRDIAVTVRESIPDPVFTLKAPAEWDGRKVIEVVPEIANLEAMGKLGAASLNVSWNVTGLATIQDESRERLVLKRAQNGGLMKVSAEIDNGGRKQVASVEVKVTQPLADAWVAHVPAKDEKPVNGQFFARDDKNEGTIHCAGTLAERADSVFLRVFADDKPFQAVTAKPAPDQSYALHVRIKPGLVKYRMEFGVKTGNAEAVLHKASGLMCGDAFIINGQSNAVATDFGKEDPAFQSEWIRTFGGMPPYSKGASPWGQAVHRGRDAGNFQIGYWGMELGRRLVEANGIPVCLVNGAVGGTRIDQHQRNPADPEDATTIYGRLLNRVRQARLANGIRGVFWHQGENDQGADGPTGGYGWETYRKYFIQMTACWKQDYPNIQHYYMFQIWPKACAMGINGSDNRLREVQRQLPVEFSNLHIMSTLGIDPPGGCHFPAAGYAEFARLIFPIVQRNSYGKAQANPVGPANLRRAVVSSPAKDEIALEFDQPVRWDDSLRGEFTIDGKKGLIATGSANGNTIMLKLGNPMDAGRISYLDSASWSQSRLLRGENGIAALTFCEVPIVPYKAPAEGKSPGR
ncbi:MAG: DUF2341 domain-containing protein [Planctomycetes bacterium]|nr:DUF2341 domain-containing protein [Planctomycetota bacterium]